jgi:hypothetical protein
METLIVVTVVSAALNLALWGVVYHKLRHLPPSVWRVAQRERLAEAACALDTLQTMAAARLGALLVGVQTYHSEMATLLNAERAAADGRARILERRASEAGIALDTATTLVREARALLDDLQGTLARASAPVRVERTRAPDVDDDSSRATVEMTGILPTREPGAPAPVSRDHLGSRTGRALPPSNEDGLLPEDDETTVRDHPLPGIRTLASVRKAPDAPGGAR